MSVLDELPYMLDELPYMLGELPYMLCNCCAQVHVSPRQGRHPTNGADRTFLLFYIVGLSYDQSNSTTLIGSP